MTCALYLLFANVVLGIHCGRRLGTPFMVEFGVILFLSDSFEAKPKLESSF